VERGIPREDVEMWQEKRKCYGFRDRCGEQLKCLRRDHARQRKGGNFEDKDAAGCHRVIVDTMYLH